MSNSSNTFCSFSCVLEIVQSPLYPRPYSLEVATCMDGTTYSDVPTLSKPDLFGIQVNYFNASKNDFPVGSLVFCQGTLTVQESVTSDPVLSVRATSLLSCPGDHTAIDYYEKCSPQNASVSFVGRVIATDTTDGCRFFSVQVTAFKHRDNGGSGYETFHLVCLMAPDIRWGRVKFPSVNLYVQAMGEIIGFTNTTSSTGSKYVCILLQNLSYIPSAQALAGTNSPSPETPPSRKRRYVEAASLFSSPNASPQSPSAAVVPETPIPSPSQVSSSTVTNIDTDVDDSPLKKKSTSKARGKGASL
ncbi:hypothetical protein V8E54_002687 [Elaphomyces granulatus]